MDCFWSLDSGNNQDEKEVSKEVTFQFEDAKMIGKKIRIRTMSAEAINKALMDNGIEPLQINSEGTQCDSCSEGTSNNVKNEEL